MLEATKEFLKYLTPRRKRNEAEPEVRIVFEDQVDTVLRPYEIMVSSPLIGLEKDRRRVSDALQYIRNISHWPFEYTVASGKNTEQASRDLVDRCNLFIVLKSLSPGTYNADTKFYYSESELIRALDNYDKRQAENSPKGNNKDLPYGPDRIVVLENSHITDDTGNVKRELPEWYSRLDGYPTVQYDSLESLEKIVLLNVLEHSLDYRLEQIEWLSDLLKEARREGGILEQQLESTNQKLNLQREHFLTIQAQYDSSREDFANIHKQMTKNLIDQQNENHAELQLQHVEVRRELQKNYSSVLEDYKQSSSYIAEEKDALLKSLSKKIRYSKIFSAVTSAAFFSLGALAALFGTWLLSTSGGKNDSLHSDIRYGIDRIANNMAAGNRALPIVQPDLMLAAYKVKFAQGLNKAFTCDLVSEKWEATNLLAPDVEIYFSSSSVCNGYSVLSLETVNRKVEPCDYRSFGKGGKFDKAWEEISDLMSMHKLKPMYASVYGYASSEAVDSCGELDSETAGRINRNIWGEDLEIRTNTQLSIARAMSAKELIQCKFFACNQDSQITTAFAGGAFGIERTKTEDNRRVEVRFQLTSISDAPDQVP